MRTSTSTSSPPESSQNGSAESSTWTRSEWQRRLALSSRQTLDELRHGLARGELVLPDATAEKLLVPTLVWELEARDAQLEPDGDWQTWYLRGGRGSGKTRAGAEGFARWIRAHLFDGVVADWGVIAPTRADAIKTCMNGPSGLIRALGGVGNGVVASWSASRGVVELADGNLIHVDGAFEGAVRIQGKNLRGVWGDEVGLWALNQWDTAWNESITFAVRISPARNIVTGTPKQGHPLVKQLLEDDDVHVTRMRTLDNVANLAEKAVNALVKRWKGTRRGRQELEGEFLEDVPGALWTVAMLDTTRLDPTEEGFRLPDLTRVVVGVDPSGASDEEVGTAEIGIVAAGYSAFTGEGYTLADRSLHASPESWARAAVDLYHELKADAIVIEQNFGGDMCRAVIHAVDRNVNVKKVVASRGKAVRAEPVSALFEQGRIHQVGFFMELEEQLTQWVPDSGMASPDRLDALVWAYTDLMVNPADAEQHSAYGGTTRPVIRRGDLTLIGRHYIDKD